MVRGITVGTLVSAGHRTSILEWRYRRLVSERVRKGESLNLRAGLQTVGQINHVWSARRIKIQ